MPQTADCSCINNSLLIGGQTAWASDETHATASIGILTAFQVWTQPFCLWTHCIDFQPWTVSAAAGLGMQCMGLPISFRIQYLHLQAKLCNKHFSQARVMQDSSTDVAFYQVIAETFACYQIMGKSTLTLISCRLSATCPSCRPRQTTTYTIWGCDSSLVC